MSKRPAVVDVASWLLWLQVAAGAAVSVLVVVLREELGASWSPMQTGDSKVEPLQFVPVILVLYGVVALTTLFLISLYRHGHNWARHSLVCISAGIVLVAVSTARTGPPAMIRFSTIAAATVSAVALVFLWHLDSRRHCLVDDGHRHADQDASV